VFRRTDLPDASAIPAQVGNVTESHRRIVLAEGDASVSTVEHLLAAVVGVAVDDLEVRVDGPELPAFDGSARAFVEALTEAGFHDNEGARAPLTIRAPFTLQVGETRYVIAPADQLRLTVSIEFEHPAVGSQTGSYVIAPDTFGAELADARTFGFREELDTLRDSGLAAGASTANAVVLGADGSVEPALHQPDEFVRHKAVDLLGDLALLGAPLHAEIVAFRPGHAGNVHLAQVIARSAATNTPPVMGIQEILGILPHRYPFLLVDRIIHTEPGQRIVGIKNVTMNEPFFPGHFPGHPVMPGVLIVEAMAQTGGMLLMGQVDDPEGKVVYFMSIDGVKFRKPVVPGDQLRFELEMLKFRGKTCRMRGVAYVDGQPVAEAEMMAAIVDR
jgi:UDP-3-O-[3-hydroxymyristoyl] N-acetylglucosamine deacetylase/3-hydroxyacyl-[acyl-carrier-protein] dehydratase